MQIPIKGSRACPTCRQKPTRIAYRSGSADSTELKQNNQKAAFLEAITALWEAEPSWEPFDEAIIVEASCFFEAPRDRRKEKYHTTYPDADKLGRMILDCLAPPKENKRPNYSVPHVISNDSQVIRTITSKYWLHAVPESFPFPGMDEPGVWVKISNLT